MLKYLKTKKGKLIFGATIVLYWVTIPFLLDGACSANYYWEIFGFQLDTDCTLFARFSPFWLIPFSLSLHGLTMLFSVFIGPWIIFFPIASVLTAIVYTKLYFRIFRIHKNVDQTTPSPAINDGSTTPKVIEKRFPIYNKWIIVTLILTVVITLLTVAVSSGSRGHYNNPGLIILCVVLFAVFLNLQYLKVNKWQRWVILWLLVVGCLWLAIAESTFLTLKVSGYTNYSTYFKLTKQHAIGAYQSGLLFGLLFGTIIQGIIGFIVYKYKHSRNIAYDNIKRLIIGTIIALVILSIFILPKFFGPEIIIAPPSDIENIPAFMRH